MLAARPARRIRPRARARTRPVARRRWRQVVQRTRPRARRRVKPQSGVAKATLYKVPKGLIPTNLDRFWSKPSPRHPARGFLWARPDGATISSGGNLRLASPPPRDTSGSTTILRLLGSDSGPGRQSRTRPGFRNSVIDPRDVRSFSVCVPHATAPTRHQSQRQRGIHLD